MNNNQRRPKCISTKEINTEMCETKRSGWRNNSKKNGKKKQLRMVHRISMMEYLQRRRRRRRGSMNQGNDLNIFECAYFVRIVYAMLCSHFNRNFYHFGWWLFSFLSFFFLHSAFLVLTLLMSKKFLFYYLNSYYVDL